MEGEPNQSSSEMRLSSLLKDRKVQFLCFAPQYNYFHQFLHTFYILSLFTEICQVLIKSCTDTSRSELQGIYYFLQHWRVKSVERGMASYMLTSHKHYGGYLLLSFLIWTIEQHSLVS